MLGNPDVSRKRLLTVVVSTTLTVEHIQEPNVLKKHSAQALSRQFPPLLFRRFNKAQ
jgi:hypothetical protein